jgi:hypothetical protein
MELAKHRLFDKGGLDASNIKVFPGMSRDVSAEQVARQINRSLSQIEVGDYDEVILD